MYHSYLLLAALYLEKEEGMVHSRCGFYFVLCLEKDYLIKYCHLMSPGFQDKILNIKPKT